MSNKFTRSFGRVLVFFNPYYSKEGWFEFSRLVAVALFSVVCFVLYMLKRTMADYRLLDFPYNLVADFYHYTIIVPASTVPTVWRWIKEQPELTSNPSVNNAVSYGSLLIYVFIWLSLYMAVYGWVQRLTKSPFRIGDFLGFYVTPLFLGGLWYYSIVGFNWLTTLR